MKKIILSVILSALMLSVMAISAWAGVQAPVSYDFESTTMDDIPNMFYPVTDGFNNPLKAKVELVDSNGSKAMKVSYKADSNEALQLEYR